MNESIIKLLKENIVELESVEVTDTLTLISSGYIDSFDIITILLRLEEVFCVQLPVDEIDLEQFETVALIAAMIRSYQEKQK